MKVFCLGDPIPEGVRNVQIGTVGDHEHWRLIESDPHYRLEQHIKDLEDLAEPPHFPWWEQERAQEAPSDTPRHVEHIKYEVHRTKGKITPKPKSNKKAGSDIAIKRK